MRAELYPGALRFRLTGEDPKGFLDDVDRVALEAGFMTRRVVAGETVEISPPMGGDVGDLWAEMYRRLKDRGFAGVRSVVYASKPASMPEPCKGWSPF